MSNLVESNVGNPTMALSFNAEQIKLIKSQIAPKATDDELKLFLYQAQRTGLDPMTRQIYCIHRKTKVNNEYVEKMSIQTSIDGFRVVAERSGSYAGQSEPIFEESNGNIIKCKISVFRFSPNGQRYEAAVGVAYWDEYKQTDYNGKVIGLWAKMPHTMLSKVCEALALRKAYPQDLSGLYTGDEMEQANTQQGQPFNATTEAIPIKEVKEEPKASNQDVIDANAITKVSEQIKSANFKTGVEYIVNKNEFLDAAKLLGASEAALKEIEARVLKFSEHVSKKNKAVTNE